VTTAPVAAGLGPYLRWARRMAARFDRLNPDLPPVRIITDRDVRRMGIRLATPHFVKGWAWDFVPDDADALLWLDSDIVPLAPLGEVPHCWRFAAREDFGGTKEVAARNGQPLAAKLAVYFNAGVFVCRRDVRHVVDSLRRFAAREPADFYKEQTWLNLAIARAVGIPDELPREWNWRPDRDGPPHEGVKLVHAAGNGNLSLLARTWQGILTAERAEDAEKAMSSTRGRRAPRALRPLR